MIDLILLTCGDSPDVKAKTTMERECGGSDIDQIPTLDRTLMFPLFLFSIFFFIRSK